MVAMPGVSHQGEGELHLVLGDEHGPRVAVEVHYDEPDVLDVPLLEQGVDGLDGLLLG
jgi:hypothetical protein